MSRGKRMRALPCGATAGMLAALIALVTPTNGQQFSGELQATHFHLAPRPAVAKPITEPAMLDMLDGLCRVTVQWQDKDGAVIDPYLHREFQYATPYFAFAVGALVRAGRGRDLLPHGIAAMEHATQQLAGGRAPVTDQHGEFFLAALSEALPVYEALVPREQWTRWRNRLRLPIDQIIGVDANNNWRTYAMKGEWQRARLGLVSHREAIAFVEKYWQAEQRNRFAPAPTSLYHDRTGDPDTLSVALVGEGNLLSLVRGEYDGPSAPEIRGKVLAALRATSLTIDPTGQVPANGRTDDHVWTEIGLQLAFSVAAPMVRADGDARTADAMERSAELSFAGLERWRRDHGSYSITKNHFDPQLRVGYQNASQTSNYTGSLMFHLAEMYAVRHATRPKAPRDAAPVEIGGYALQLDGEFATAFANAGGLEMQFNLRGETEQRNDNWWTPLGAVRIARSAWDTRLGPSDGAQTATAAASFAPEFLRDGRWTRLAELPAEYEAHWSVQLVNPAIVRCTLEYRPVGGKEGPVFRDRFTLTPDGALSTVERRERTSAETAPWGVTWPLLTNDGRPLRTRIGERIAEAAYPDSADTESFLAIDQDSTLDSDEKAVRSTYGDLLPIRVQTSGAVSNTFIYPHNTSQPNAENVLRSFRLTSSGFESELGRVEGDVYISSQFAGGRAKAVDLKSAGHTELTFNRTCGFVAQLRHGALTAIETDRSVAAHWHGHTYRIAAYHPLVIAP